MKTTCILCNKLLSNKINFRDFYLIKTGNKEVTDEHFQYKVISPVSIFFVFYYDSLIPVLMFFGVIWMFSYKAFDLIFGEFSQGWITTIIVSSFAVFIFILIEYFLTLIIPLTKVSRSHI